MRNVLVILLAIVFVAGAAYALEAPDEKASGNEQVKVEGAFRATWVLPDADITHYTKIYPWKAKYEFREGGETKAAETTTERLRGGGGPYTIREESKEKFEKTVNMALINELGRSKIFEIVDEVGPNTLLVRASVLDIISNVPPNFAGDEIYLSSVGEATFIFELIDAETGVVQATGGERRTIQGPSARTAGVNTIPANSATVWAEVDKWATEMARDLRKALEKAHKKASK